MSESTSQAPGDAAAYNVEYMHPAGVRFLPTDKELIVDYLGRKLRSEPLGTDVVRDGRDVYAEHPKKLLPKLGEAIEGAWYLFSPRNRKCAGGMRAKRETGDGEGCWRAIDAEKSIFGSAGNMEVIGTQRRLAFHEFIYEADSQGSGKRKRVKRSLSKPTKWKMVEFVCRNSSRPPGGDTAPDPMLLNDLVLCKITISSEKQPAPDGGGEPQEKRLPRQQPAGCGGGGGTQGEPQQPPPFGLGAGSHDNQRPATVEAPNGGDSAVLPIDYCLGAQHVADVRWFRINTPTIFNSYYHTGMVYGGGELLGAQLAAQQQPAVAPGRAAATDAGSSEWGRCFTASRALPGNWQVPPWDLPDECFLYFDDRTNNA